MHNMMTSFQKVQLQHQAIIFSWLEKPHVKAFWDNSQEHREDIVLFINGRQLPSPYFDGLFTYWIGCDDQTPYCLLMTSDLSELPNESEKNYLSATGKTISLDFMIGNEDYVGKGLAADTLSAFMQFMRGADPTIDTFIIDPSMDNPLAAHVYEKAGFEVIDRYQVEKGYFINQENLLMRKVFSGMSND